MENKKTTELIDELENLADEDYDDGGKRDQIMTELTKREPFSILLSEYYDESLPKIAEIVFELQDDVKLLKRHKHDEKNGDVLVRI